MYKADGLNSVFTPIFRPFSDLRVSMKTFGIVAFRDKTPPQQLKPADS